MKKRKLKTLLCVTIILTMIMAMMGCGTTDNEKKDDTTEGAKKVTVTFYDSDGTTVLKTEEIEKGATVSRYVPEKTDYIFVDWFATPSMGHRFDFNTAIEEDTSVFAGFVSYKEDTRDFYIVGSGKSELMLQSSWGNNITDAHKMTKANGENVYTITLDLEAGDQFQFVINESWHDQRGYGYLTAIEQDGVQYFSNSGGLGETSTKRSNMEIKVSGNYTFTLTTYPAEDTYETTNASYSEDNKECFNINPYDTIEFKYNGESQGTSSDIVTDYYIKGAVITGWEDKYEDNLKFTNNDNIYTLQIQLEEGDEFLFTTLVSSNGVSSVGTEYVRYTNIDEADTASLELLDSSEGYNMITKATGNYTFTYNAETKVLSVTME